MKRRQKIDHFLGNSVNIGFGFQDIVKETTNKLMKHLGREIIHVKQFLDNLKLRVKGFIVGTKIQNSVK